jgi:hypothetical protein
MAFPLVPIAAVPNPYNLPLVIGIGVAACYRLRVFV